MTTVIGKTVIWAIFVSPPFPTLTSFKFNEQNLCQAMLWVCKIVMRERGEFKTSFLKFSQHFVTDCRYSLR